nr:condensation domain-containing protein [Desulfobacterales bacterium]
MSVPKPGFPPGMVGPEFIGESMKRALQSSNLTTGQFRIWAGQKLDPDRPLYNMALAFHIQGELQPELFRAAFQVLINRSDALRSIIIEEDGIPRQEILPTLDDHMDFQDLSGHHDPRGEAQSRLKERSMRIFEMDKRLFECMLLKIADGEFIWYLNQHHLFTDGWSCAILYRRMSDFYHLAQEGRLEDAPQLPPFFDYQTYEKAFRKTNDFAAAAAYWEKKKSASPAPIEFYGNIPSNATTGSERLFCDIGPERSTALRKLTLESDFRSFSMDLSLFNIFSALLYAFLYRISGNTRLIIGTPSHHRPTTTFKETIGLFIELFPLEVSIAPRATFRSLIKAVAPVSFDFLKNALPGTGGIRSGNTYSVVLNYINTSFGDFCGMPMHSTWIHPDHVDRGHTMRLQVQDFDQTG